MSKNLIILLLCGAVAYLGYQYYHKELPPPRKPSTGATTTTGTLCAQVITPARNPKTSEIREFPTLCDVPKGWEVIENDVPGLDLQVQ